MLCLSGHVLMESFFSFRVEACVKNLFRQSGIWQALCLTEPGRGALNTACLVCSAKAILVTFSNALTTYLDCSLTILVLAYYCYGAQVKDDKQES